MIIKAFVIWSMILLLAILNGGLRTILIVPKIGEPAGHVVSTIILCGLILLVSRISMSWVGPKSKRENLLIGLFWVLLTVGFEFLAGHYAFKKSWENLLADYKLAQGRVWVLVLITNLLAPTIAVWGKSK
jgi:hypothetical protein